ncbi:hypothetical protein ALC62_01996, partial [Cyphomyrmex costatus]
KTPPENINDLRQKIVQECRAIPANTFSGTTVLITTATTLAELRMSIRWLSSKSACTWSTKGVTTGWTISLAWSSPVAANAKIATAIATPETDVTCISSTKSTTAATWSVVLISSGTCATPW